MPAVQKCRVQSLHKVFKLSDQSPLALIEGSAIL